MAFPIRIEYAHQRKMRTRNTKPYRMAHWPIWIWVFFLAPGPLTFDLFAHGGNRWNWIWLALVLVGTGIAALFGQLPGAEPAPYILRFTEDRPNPLYRRICYTFAWNALVNFALLNLAGLAWAVVTREWRMKQIYAYGYTPVLAVMLLLGITGVLPRVRRSTKGEGNERRSFYTAIWSITAAQTALLILWKVLPKTHGTDIAKFDIYVLVLVGMSLLGASGILPRTRPILPGELMVAD
jgi:hypothetical protein